MPQYKVQVEDQVITTYIIEAANSQAAQDMAEQQHSDGEPCFDRQVVDRSCLDPVEVEIK